jgi:hypothetical protein
MNSSPTAIDINVNDPDGQLMYRALTSTFSAHVPNTFNRA